MLATTQQPPTRTHRNRANHDKRRLTGNTGHRTTPNEPTTCGHDEDEPTQHAGHAPVAPGPPHWASQTKRTSELTGKTTQTTPGYTGTGCSAIDPATHEPTIRRLTRPDTNQTTAEKTIRQSTDRTQASQHQTSQACEGQNKNGVPSVGDTKMRHAHRQPSSRTHHNAEILPLNDRPTNHNDLLPTPGPPGKRKLDRVRRRECAPRHASPVARASSSCLTPTENQPRRGCLQDRAFGPAPGP